MYVVTFYSFKGGVGRTMALANVALSLAKAGRRVLLVDFDLEAPGIETFELLRPPQPTKGVVDFVSDYVAENATPDVRDYVYECQGIPDLKGKAWVMPAGLRDAGYGQRLSSIDWQKLYAERDGYLMIEDLKAQWAEAFNPDYVFLDSRTGHTDVGGICTRQLPNAVVVLFFPNEQNFLGLQKVIADIRAEAQSPRKKKIELHFVSSNVPDLDDENQILVAQFENFKKALGYGRLSATIHHYPSLALLRQDLFSLTNPTSRLAKEYDHLRGKIIFRNPADREGALQHVAVLLALASQDPDRPSIFGPAVPEFEGQSVPSLPRDVGKRLKIIRQLHPKDGELLFGMALVQSNREQNAEVLELLADAEAAGYVSPSLYAIRADAADSLGDREYEAIIVDSLEMVLAQSGVGIAEFVIAANLLYKHRRKEIGRLHQTPAFRSLPMEDQVSELGRFMTESWREALPGAALVVLNRLNAGERICNDDLDQLSLALIASGEFQDATRILEALAKCAREGQTETAFNHAMASWGLTGSPDTNLFATVIRLDAAKVDELFAQSKANYNQSLAIALWASGKPDAALARAKRATDEFRVRSRRLSSPPVFSAWRYLSVSPSTFMKDMAELEKLLSGKGPEPLFIRRAKAARKGQAAKGTTEGASSLKGPVPLKGTVFDP